MTTSLRSVPEHLRTDFDIYDPALTHPVDRVGDAVQALAEQSPLMYSEKYGGHWVVTRYDEVHEVLRNPETYSSFPNNLVPHGAGRFIPLEIDPPDHTAFRKALQPLFSPTRMRALEPRIRAIINELLDGFTSRGSAEYISEFAHELPARVFLALMEWPLDDAPMFTQATDTTLRGVPGGTEEESNAAREAAAGQLFGYFGGIVADRRARGAEASDITSQIVHQEIELDGVSRPLSDEELCNMFFLLLIAGLHTVTGTLAWSVMHLADRPDERQRLIDDPSLVPAAVEEMLRMEAAVSMGRRVRHDVTLGGVDLKEGDQLLLVLHGANRDGREFPDPDVVKVDRTPNRHLSFGSGPHRCLGSHLARIEISLVFEELHKRIPDYRVDPAKQVVSHASQVRGVLDLPILFTPEA
ncbi:cytochrome P450 [Pseudonocardia xishanensis]|uniref:Cytochrome P450 n=1 Tax=Pseudonocardia xishanensis TaxID=630995 RepID=A0ABP8RSI7_9PSEU